MGYRPSRSSLPSSRSRTRAIVAPHAYRGRISRPGSPFVSPGSRTLSIEKTAKQVLERERERELTCVPRPFQLRSFQGGEKKNPFPIFDRNKSCGPCIYSYALANPSSCVSDTADVDSGSKRAWTLADVPTGRGRPVVPPSCFPEYFSGVHGHAWPLAGTTQRRVSPFVRLGFDVSRILVDSWERCRRRCRRVSNRRRDRFHNCARVITTLRRTTWEGDRRYGKVPRGFGFKIETST